MTHTDPKPNIRLWLMGLILFALPGFLLSCGGGSGSGSLDNDSGTCALAFDIEWNRETPMDSSNSQQQMQGKLALPDCEDVVSVRADVYDVSGTGAPLRSGGPWPCSAGQGEIQDVPAGSTGRVTIFGNNANGGILYRGQSGEIELIPSQTVYTGTITANSFVPQLSLPANGSTVSSSTAWQLQWSAVAGAAGYRVVISTNHDLSNAVLDTTPVGNNTTYSPAGLQDDQYYWQISAIDAKGNESAGSAIWGFLLALGENTAPTAQIESPSDGAVYETGTAVLFSGAGSDLEDGSLSGNSLTWASDLDGALGAGSVLQISTLSVGTHTITLTATDSSSAIGTASIRITIVEAAAQDVSGTWQFSVSQPWAEGDAGCTAGDSVSGICQITQTGNSFTLEFLSGLICDPAFTCTYSGTVSDNHYVGSNSGVVDSEGGVVTNTIDFTATSEDTLSGQSTSQYDLAEYQCRWGYDLGMVPPSGTDMTPIASIDSPLSGTIWEMEDSIFFNGSGTDPEDGQLTGTSLVWTSNINGQFHTGASFYYSGLSTGTHDITLTVVDSHGNSDSDTTTISINSPPSVTISSPENGTRFDSGTSVTFSGSATDPEDGAISGSALSWQSSIDGNLGTGSSITASDLSYGNHTITLSTVDSRGISGSASINMRVNDLPWLTIYQPFDNSHFIPGVSVTFEAMTSDPEDGSIPNASIVWTSSIDGQVGTGSYTGSSSLSYGAHTLTCTVTDSLGDSTSESINLVINTPPVATIIQPLNGSMEMPGTTINCQGSWSDAEETLLPTANLVWTYRELPSGPEVTIGNGTSTSVVFSDFGNFRIYFRVTDSLGDTNIVYVDFMSGG